VQGKGGEGGGRGKTKIAKEKKRERDGKENRTTVSLGKRRTIRVCGGFLNKETSYKCD
jgi:hypothetical protein